MVVLDAENTTANMCRASPIMKAKYKLINFYKS